jgi:hypothetical protein
MKRASFGLYLLFLCLGMSPNAQANQLVLNGGFESITPPPEGSFNMDWAKPNSWITTAQAFSNPELSYPYGPFSNSLTIEPNSGDRMGVLAPGGLNSNAMWQTVNFSGWSSATLSFWWRVQALDFDEADVGQDRLQVLIAQNFNETNPNPTWTTIWNSSLSINPNIWVVSDWAFVSIPLNVAGWELTTFKFNLINSGVNGGEYGNWENLTGQATTVFLDDVSIEAVPEPTSLLLLCTGLGAMGLAGWRKRK